MGKLAFLNNKLIWAGGDDPPRFLDAEGELETEVVITKYEDTFDPLYEYSYEEIDGELYAKQGDLVVVDPVEEERMYNEVQAVKYREERQQEYPSIGDQLDMIMKDKRDGTTTHQEVCEAIKTKYPKP